MIGRQRESARTRENCGRAVHSWLQPLDAPACPGGRPWGLSLSRTEVLAADAKQQRWANGTALISTLLLLENCLAPFTCRRITFTISA